MKYVVFVILIFTMVFEGIAQTHDGTRYAKAKVYLQDHKVISAKDFTISGMEASFFDSNSGKQKSMMVDEIDFIKIPKGNHVLVGASFGAATGALSSLLIDLDTDALGRPQEKDAGFYLAMTGGGAVLGALVGLLVPKWKPIYLNKKSVGFYLPLQFDVSSEMGVATIKISMKI
ncbi:hypothetical protein FVB32_08340 [Flagellimonas hymeniacidonis]|uniref:Uncharacterized protein n=1 Tax=Flagellimonas hymeniacidonis TaxID=2603628 RepID=A0A5C8VAX8_9FLAO|nr:hypothetical protein [Flagellimonas hymeniacidonis]TXN38289.1 hypothetical protein FVB32_08340 [Flagellimonas hymeniacidonis]